MEIEEQTDRLLGKILEDEDSDLIELEETPFLPKVSAIGREINESQCRYLIDRPAQTETQFNKHIAGPEVRREIPSTREKVKKCARDFDPLAMLLGLFPILTWMRKYNLKNNLAGDLVAGLTVGVVHIPQSMAFSILAGLPPVFGLYTSFFPVLIYTLMGTSRHISVGTFAVTSLLTRAVVNRHAPIVDSTVGMDTNDTATIAAFESTTISTSAQGFTELDLQRAGVAAALMLLMGIFQLVFGIFRLGFITAYLSEPLVQAFTTGAAIHVVTSQTPAVLGISITSSSGMIGAVFLDWIEIFKNIPNTNIATLIISIVCFILLIIGRQVNIHYKERLKIPVPTEVIVVIIAILASYFGNFQSKFGVAIVDDIPTGLPAPRVPEISVLSDIIGDGFAIAIVGFAISVSLSKMYAQKHGYAIDPNQELIAYGVSNLIPSFFLCFPNAAALARCEIQDNTGGKTQVVGILSVVIVLITILVLGPIFEPLPRSVLGSIIIVGLFGILMQFSNLKSIYKISKVDFLVWVVTLAAVVVLGVDLGLLAGVVFSIFTVIVRTQAPKCEIVASVNGTDVYRNCVKYNSATPCEGVVIFRFQSVMYYANKDYFKQKLFMACGVNPDEEIARRREENKPKTPSTGSHCWSFGKREYPGPVPAADTDSNIATSSETSQYALDISSTITNNCLHALILDCSAFTFIDLVGIKTLKSLAKSFQEIDVSFLLANVCEDVRNALKRGGFYGITGYDCEFVTVHDAAIYAQFKMKPTKPYIEEIRL